MRLEGDFDGALQDLKWLSWHRMKDLNVANLELSDLVILDLSSERITDDFLSAIKVHNFCSFTY